MAFLDQPERQRVLGMRMNHRRHVGPRLEDRGMNETLEVGLALVLDRLALLVEFDQIVTLDQLRRPRARHEETLRIVGMPHADMAVGVDHILVGQNAIGDHKVAQQIIKLAHRVSISAFPFQARRSVPAVMQGCT